MPVRLTALAGLLAGLVLALPAAGHAAPTASSAATCSVKSDGRKLGPTYVTALSATGTSCTTAKKVVKAFDACRRANGGADGTCTKKVRGYRCRETRGEAIPTQYDAKVRCTTAGRSVRFSYTQFT